MADPWRAFTTRLYDQNLFAIKLGLDNMRRALRLEGHPETHAPAIVVGGTNGKGTTCAVLAGILQAHGLRVGLFTSPHLIEVRERFRVNGAPIPREDVLRVGKDVLKRYGRPDSDPVLTFFELTTVIGAHLFKEFQCDVVVWEVGLGGRLDAVNTIEPALTIVTCIDLDHEAYLGNTIEAIAAEKAALFRKDVPCIIGAQDHLAATEVLKRAAPHASLAGRDFDVDESNIRTRHESTARAAAKRFLGERWRAELEDAGVRGTRWPGRMHRLDATAEGLVGPWLLDAAHNPAGARQLFEHLKSLDVGAFVVGASRDKDTTGLLANVRDVSVPVYGVVMETRRSSTSDMLEDWVANITGVGPCLPMMQAARAAAGNRLVVVFGSIYLLGECFHALGFESDDLITFEPGT